MCVMSWHLESFIGKEDTSSGERVAQMEDVFRTLDGIVERRVNDRKKASGDVFPTGVQNALFAGDTNWDEKRRRRSGGATRTHDQYPTSPNRH